MRPSRATLVSFGLALAAALVLLLAPLGTQVSAVPAGSGARSEVAHTSLLAHDGWDVAIPLSIPVVIAAVPLVWRRRLARIISAVLLGGFVVVGMASFGLFFAPAWVAMVVGAVSRSGEARSVGS
ncbi:MAG: hypothetical protein ABR518_02190 [Actinomycetota bacterium]